MKDVSKCTCGSQNIYCIDSRKVDGSIRRRKECKDCGRRFTTYEVEDETFVNYLKFLNSISGIKVCVDFIYESLENKKIGDLRHLKCLDDNFTEE